MNTLEPFMAEAPAKEAVIDNFSGISANQSLRDCVDQAMENYFRMKTSL